MIRKASLYGIMFSFDASKSAQLKRTRFGWLGSIQEGHMSSASSTMPVTSSDQISVGKSGSHYGVIGWNDDRVVRLLHLRHSGHVISPLIFSAGQTRSRASLTWPTFAVGFMVRPFGALFFGRIGDLVGRKYAFLVTLLIMGGSTLSIGFLPSYARSAIAAPIILVVIRVLQGLALGGEYGGAAVYVAEHVPDDKRGFYTSFIQITATLGLFVSLAVILIARA